MKFPAFSLPGVLACVILAGCVTASAVKPPQVSRNETERVLSGSCCFLWGDTVTVKEPATVVTVIVTWSTTYFLNLVTFGVGLSLNGGPCTFYGSIALAPTQSYVVTTHQWVLLSGDGLRKGTNTITVCGGGANPNDAIALLSTSLAVRTGN